MTVQAGDYVYTQQTSTPDQIGVAWIYVSRREVVEVEGGTVLLSGQLEARFPEHSPPEVEDISWCTPAHALPCTLNQAIVDAQYLTELSLPDPYVFADEQAVIEDRNRHRQHRYANRNRATSKPAPALDASQAFEFHVLDWRYPW